MLIVGLPPVYQEKLLEDIISHPLVAAVRYNTGMDSSYSPQETLLRILSHTKRHKKPLYVDLKGQQLRIQEWATLPYGPILLNHKIKVEFPAKVYFRGDDCCDLKEISDGRKIYVDPLPKYPVGRGQAINILAKKLEIEDYLTDNDEAYIEAATKEGIANFMLSFVESMDYIRHFENTLERCEGGKELLAKLKLVFKIESQAGIDFVSKIKRKLPRKYQLMAARDDLMIQIGELKMIEALKMIIQKDPEAICASRLLLGFEQAGAITMADISDLRLMQMFGYKKFMFSDGISRNHFKKAVEFWEKYISIYPNEK